MPRTKRIFETECQIAALTLIEGNARKLRKQAKRKLKKFKNRVGADASPRATS